jgi:hypothetical protein
MIIALLAILGVSLWVILAFVALMIARRRWLTVQPGAFRCATRAINGDVPRVGGRRWRRGWGRRAQDVLVWDPMPTLVGSSMLQLADVEHSRPAASGEIRRMGDAPLVVEIALQSGARLAVAVRDEDAARALRGATPTRQVSSSVGG